MKRAELNITLLEYANEDLGYARTSGSIVITDTLRGLITIDCTMNIYQAYNSLGEALTGDINEERMTNWLKSQYDTTAVELED